MRNFLLATVCLVSFSVHAQPINPLSPPIGTTANPLTVARGDVDPLARAALPATGGTMTGALVGTSITAKNFAGTGNFTSLSGALTAATVRLYDTPYLQGSPAASAIGETGPYQIGTTDILTPTSGSMTVFSVKSSPGAAITGTRQAILGQVNQTGTPAVSAYDNIYNAIQGVTFMNVNNGGTGGGAGTANYPNYHGSAFGMNPQIICGASSSYLRLCNGMEIDTTVLDTSAPPAEKYGFSVVQAGADAARGVDGDAAMFIANQSTALTTWKQGIQFGSFAGYWPFGTDSTLISGFEQGFNGGCTGPFSQGGTCPQPVAAIGIDFTKVAFTTGAVAFPGYSIGPVGQVTQAAVTTKGAEAHKRTTVADAAYTVLSTDYLIAETSLTATRAIILPCTTTGSAAEPQYFIVKDESGQAGSFPITLIGTVDGATNKTINIAYGAAQIYSNGSACFTW